MFLGNTYTTFYKIIMMQMYNYNTHIWVNEIGVSILNKINNTHTQGLKKLLVFHIIDTQIGEMWILH
jgi:hypothetical protein